MLFKENDLVEYDFHGEKTLGFVTKDIDNHNIRVTKKDGTSYTWDKSQCTVLARNGKWVRIVTLTEAWGSLKNLDEACQQLLSAGEPAITVVSIAYELGSNQECVNRNGVLHTLLQKYNVEVVWV